LSWEAGQKFRDTGGTKTGTLTRTPKSKQKNSNRRKIFCTETGSEEREKNTWHELAKNK
jgi:hypothetical protein